MQRTLIILCIFTLAYGFAFAADPITATHQLARSHSSLKLTLSDGYFLALGEDAANMCLEVGLTPDDLLEAAMAAPNGDLIYVEYFPVGYVFLKGIDSAALLAEIREFNEMQVENCDEISEIKWFKEPTLDKNKNAIFYVYKYIYVDLHPVVYAVVLKFGRKGYEKITWATDEEAYLSAPGDLNRLARSHSFDPGYHYDDYGYVDKFEEHGSVILATFSNGTKVVQLGWFAGLWMVLESMLGSIF